MTNDPGGPAHGPEEREELFGDEGGQWCVETQGSVHLFDLDRFTVTRVPGPTSQPGINDRTRPIRSIEACRVGASGFWKMEPEGEFTIDFFWQISSRIKRISRRQVEPDQADERPR